MAADRLLAVLLAVYCLVTVSDLVVKSSDSSTQLTVYERCKIYLELGGNCIFVVTFSNCMKRSMIKTGLKGRAADDTTSAKDRNEWIRAKINLGSTDGQKALAHLCSCNTSVGDIATMKANFYNEWAKLVSHGRWSEKACLLELVDLFRASDDACYFQNTKTEVNIQCQLSVNQTGPSCLWTWSRLRPCNGYQTRTLRRPLCICVFRHKVLQSDLQTDISLSEKTFAASMEETTRDVATVAVVNSLEAENLHDGTLEAGGHLCPEGAAHANCTLVKERSTETKYCSPGYFGKACDQRCRCKNKASCDRNTGNCDNGCEIGWMGLSCNYRSCPVNNNTKYGVLLSGLALCLLPCMCSSGEDCNILTGECMTGQCPNTEEGDLCADQVCPRHFIRKPSCVTKCYCYNEMVCNPANGRCPGGLCQSGYQPPDCIVMKTIPMAGLGALLVLLQMFIVLTKIAIVIHLRVIPMFF